MTVRMGIEKRSDDRSDEKSWAVMCMPNVWILNILRNGPMTSRMSFEKLVNSMTSRIDVMDPIIGT